MRRRVERRRKQRGAAMVEFAIISLVLFMLFFALIDMGLIEIGNTATGNAAREGARVAALYPAGADVDGQPSNTAVVNAVRTKLVGLTTILTITVTCTTDDGSVTIACANGAADHDIVTVSVTYRHKGVSPFVKTTTRTESASVVLLGSGPYSVLTTTTTVAGSTTSTTTPPPHCTLDSSGLSSSTATIAGGSEPGSLQGSTTITVVTTATCSTVKATFFYPNNPTLQTIVLNPTGLSNTFSAPIGGSSWVTGLYTFTINDYYGPIPNETLQLRVSSSSVCSVLTSSVSPPTTSPPAAVLATTTEPAALASGTVVQVNMTSTGACGNVYVTFSTGNTGTARSELMTRSGTSYTFTSSAAQPSTWYSTWTTGLKIFSFTNGASPPVPYEGPTPTLQVNAPPPACNVSVRFHDSTTTITSVNVREHGNEGELDTPFSVTVTPSGTCNFPIYARWDRGKGFGTGIAYGQAALSSNTYLIPKVEGGDRAWAKTGIVSFRFFDGVPGTTNQLTPLTPPTLELKPVK